MFTLIFSTLLLFFHVLFLRPCVLTLFFPFSTDYVKNKLSISLGLQVTDSFSFLEIKNIVFTTVHEIPTDPQHRAIFDAYQANRERERDNSPPRCMACEIGIYIFIIQG